MLRDHVSNTGVLPAKNELLPITRWALGRLPMIARTADEPATVVAHGNRVGAG